MNNKEILNFVENYNFDKLSKNDLLEILDEVGIEYDSKTTKKTIISFLKNDVSKIYLFEILLNIELDKFGNYVS